MQRSDFDDVQRVVLCGDQWLAAEHLVIEFTQHAAPLCFLNRLFDAYPPTPALPAPGAQAKPALQISLGFSRRGLARARVPSFVLARFAARAPAFDAGAARRASNHVGNHGPNGPANWDEPFNFMRLDAVLTVHARELTALDAAFKKIEEIAVSTAVCVRRLPRTQQLTKTLQPAEIPAREQYVHFGFRDGLSRVGITGWSKEKYLQDCLADSIHAAGEFILGHPQNSQANPWLSSDGRKVWPEELRAFFHNGSFGVLHQVEQFGDKFYHYLDRAAKATNLGVDAVRAKLCGRRTDGRPVGRADSIEPTADFEYNADTKGEQCPFGAHARRMNPRGGELAQTRRRPLLRRGMPYTSPLPPAGDGQRGLLGLFFCASIEGQFEHLLGQWADRVPLGSPDPGGARDPLIGAHEAGDGRFVMRGADGRLTALPAMPAFTRTRGTAYLFYPSVTVLHDIARNEVFADIAEPELEAEVEPKEKA